MAVSWHDFPNLIDKFFIMDNTNGVSTGKKAKKEFRKTVAAKLASCLEEFRTGLKEKKFNAAIKRASKLLASDLYAKAKKDKNKPGRSLTVVEEEIGA